MTQPALRLFNTLTGRMENFEPLEPGKVKLYVCGPTVYDAAHLGHARCYITWDVLVRFLRFLGYDVTYARNVTDVDDKILNKAAQIGKLPADVARENLESFHEDMKALNVLPPDHEPKATESIPTMIQAIQALIDKDAAYATPEGTVYFRVDRDSNYGQLSKKPLDELKSGARVEVDPYKENPLDFALWKAVPPEERTDEKLSHGYCFESPWGRGRPGWHIECSAMNFALFGKQIDIHAGGADLVFPHHENEIAQTETWHDLHGGTEEAHANERFSKYWLHNGFVNVSGEKMSKSLGNFSTIQKVLERYDANTIRYFLLTNGYRMPVDFNDESLQAAENAMQRIGKRVRNLCKALKIQQSDLNQLVIHDLKQLEGYTISLPINFFVNVMLDDLNTPQALAVISEWFRSITDDVERHEEVLKVHNQQIQGKTEKSHPVFPTDPVKAAFINLISVIFHLGFNLSLMFETGELPIEESVLRSKVEERLEARKSKDWVTSDRIRDELKALGIQLLDNKDGTTTWELLKP